MRETIENLVEAFRDELQQYGEMLSLLEQQQAQVAGATHKWVPRISDTIKAQAFRIQQARFRREKFQEDLAGTLKEPSGTGPGEMLAGVPAEYRPLLKALMEENAVLLEQVQEKVQQNHLLLLRSLHTSQAHAPPLPHSAE